MRQPEVGTRWFGAASAILAAALFVAIAAYAWLGTYTRYMTDDYCTAATLREHGLVEAMRLHREAWSGRFSFYAIKGALESIGPVTARAVPGLMIVLLAATSAWSLRRLFGDTSMRFAVIAGLAIAYTNLDTSPSRESRFGPFLWETGAITYMLPAVLLAAWIGVLICRGSLVRCGVASAVLMLVAGGLSETSLAAQGALTGGAIVLALFIRDSRMMWISASGLAGTLAALTIMATAPGNALRMATLPARAGLLDTLLRTVRLGHGYFGSHLFVEGAALLIVMTLGLIAGFTFPRVRTSVAAGGALIAFGAYLATFAPSAWILPAGPPARALYVSNFFLIAMLFAAFAAAGTTVRRERHARVVRFAAVALLALVIVPIRSTVAVVRAIPESRSEARQADAVVRDLASRRGQEVVLLSPWAFASRFATDDATHWTNRCVSRFYELRSLSVVRR